MRIGITVDIQHSMFSAGHPNSCIAVMEAMQVGGHEVVLLRKEPGETWWDDVLSLKDEVAIEYVDEARQMDLVIEVGFFLSPLQRARLSNVCVWYCRKPALFTDIEGTVYGARAEGRDLEGVSEIWLADIFNGQDDRIYLETLYPRLPVKVVPWLWSPTIVEAHRKEKGSPVWIQMNQLMTSDSKWSLHVCETNMSNTSSSTIPMVILKNAGVGEKLLRINVHNSEEINKSQFFKENVKKQCVFEVELNMVGRQRCIDWSSESGSIILSHARFLPLKQANLEAAWVGIPLVHNCPVLKELGLEKGFYNGNSILEASTSLKALLEATSTLEELSELRKRILYKFSPEARASEWLVHLSSVSSVSSVVPSADMPIQQYEKKKFHMLFTDMWDQFNVEHNTFTLALEAALNDTEVLGYSLETLPKGTKPDIHIFGPFGFSWKEVEGPKVHFTGENTGPIEDSSVILNIGFQINASDNYLRMPLWMFELDWFGADLARIQNPLPLPIETATQIVESKDRTKFCAFIVSNPKNPVRNEAFHALNKYKPVDSAGRLFNTMGDEIFAGLGGGGGELKKHMFLRDYRFCLAYENEQATGYVTEKLLHAKAAGCVPIYWGSSSALTDFNPNGFIDASNKSIEEMVAMVKAVDEDPVKWKEMASIPALSSEAVDQVRATFSKMAQKILEASKNTANVPKLIGRKKSVVSKTPYFVTGTTLNFLPSLNKWLDSLNSHMKNGYPDLLARVYVGKDVPEAVLIALTKEYEFATFLRFPVNSPSNFPDFWEPQHYAWKLWILKETATDPELSGKLVFYMDSGSSLIRMPIEWIDISLKSKVSVLEDSGHLNSRWCHEKFCKILKVTDDELSGKQLAACLLFFVGGSPLAKRFFSEAYNYGCIRDCIVGEKWVRDVNGEIRGHRHDQSILSVLSQRYNIHRFPLDKIYNDTSARSTYYTGKSVYVHRGNYITHIPFLDGMDDTLVINLDRRPDRRAAFLEAHPEMKGRIKRHTAYDGIQLNLTPKLASLFKPNDFFWKKAVMGCSLSHLKLWTMLLAEPVEIESYLILEDDVRFVSDWESQWRKIYPKVPDNWECIYLGGVLPPNKKGFKNVLEPVSECPGLARIAPNTFFGQSEPTRQFHFCTYAYILSRRGAEKLIKAITMEDGIWTSADHLLFNPLDKDNLYVVNPLLAGASQDDDPAYINSDFNDFSRKDKFDSDLWNNDERFSKEEVEKCLSKSSKLDILGALNEIPIGNQVRKVFLGLDITGVCDTSIYEGPWLREFFPEFTIQQVSLDTNIDRFHEPFLVVIKPRWEEQIQWILKVAGTGKKFKILHLSDEFCQDPIDFYSIPQVTGVLRFYPRPDLVKTLTLPLGYHWPMKNTIPICARSIVWSFCGTNWMRRSELLAPLFSIEPNKAEFYPEWNSKNQLNNEEFSDLLQNTQFVPCPLGNNVETYRLYEALEAGCIPVFTQLPPVLYNSKIPFLKTETWIEVATLIEYMVKNPKQLEEYHRTLMEAWKVYKEELKRQVKLL